MYLKVRTTRQRRENDRCYYTGLVVLGAPRTMSESNSQPKEGTASSPASGGTELKECMVCGAVGLSERISSHDCEEFLDHKDLQSH